MNKLTTMLSFIIIAFMLLIPTVTAWEFDNVKSYDTTTKTATITNALGLGDDIAKVKLNSETHRTILDKNDYVAEWTITNYAKDYENFISQLEFYDYNKLQRGIEEVKLGSFIYKYWNADYISTRIINITKETCTGVKNVSYSCTTEVTGTREETTIGAWLEFNDKNLLPLGEVTIRAFYTG